MSYSEQDWERLGRLLAQRRGQLGSQFMNRQEFVRTTGLNDRLVYDLENGRRSGYRPATIAAVETAYRIAPGAIRKALADPSAGELAAEASGGDADTDGDEVLPDLPADTLTPEELLAALLERPPADVSQEIVENWPNYEDWERAIWHLPLSMDVRSWLHGSTCELLLIIARGIEADKARQAAEVRDGVRRGNGSRAS